MDESFWTSDAPAPFVNSDSAMGDVPSLVTGTRVLADLVRLAVLLERRDLPVTRNRRAHVGAQGYWVDHAVSNDC